MKITKVTITPVALAGPPLLTAAGVREPYALRAIIEVGTDAGLAGLGETCADDGHLAALSAAAAAIEGADVYRTEGIYRRVQAVVGRVAAPGVTAVPGGPAVPGGSAASGLTGPIAVADRVFAPFEMACLDIQGQAAGRPVCDLLGGPARNAIAFSACLFYKWAAHPEHPVTAPDPWGPALGPDAIVAQAKEMVDRYGFTVLKLTGGVFPPDEEIAAVRALREAFPHRSLRLDPGAAWTPETAIHVARELDGVLEYLQDPTPGLDGMAEVAKHAPMPLAASACVTSLDCVPPAVSKQAARVILSDFHDWGGLRRSTVLAGICETFGLRLSMYSDSHLGISMSAMVHLAAATPSLIYVCDTHWPWKSEDVVNEPFAFAGGAVRVPDTPGLGVTLDRNALARLHEQYLTCGIHGRDDTGYMRRVDPSYERKEPRW